MMHKLQLTYRSGRTVIVESDDYLTLDEMVRDMSTSHWFVHRQGAENMMEVERIKPVGNVNLEIRKVK